MSVKRQTVDGRPALIADRPDGYTVISFQDNGERIVLAPAEETPATSPSSSSSEQ